MFFNQSAVAVGRHTTASYPRPHVLYEVDVTSATGEKRTVSKRYSEFVSLQQSLGDDFSLPPKRVLAPTFIPSAWVDDTLISERKSGLTIYLSQIIRSPEYQDHPALVMFLETPSSNATAFDIEDALPSTLSRRDAVKLSKEAQQLSVDSTSKPLACAYYPDWATSPTPSSIAYTKFDIVYFAFATPSSSHALDWDTGSQSMLKSLVSHAHSSGSGTRVVLSVGGWGGSYYFSQTMSSSSNRATFVTALKSAVSTYDLDGIDIDWEYPNEPGAGNPYSSKDSANFLLFLESLRSALGSTKIISAAVTDLPWTGSDGNPLQSVSSYAKYMTYANIMNYDVNGASSTPGPNAPLSNACGTSDQPTANAVAAFQQWTAAGFPAKQLMLGLPLYGYVSESTATHLTGSFKNPGKSDNASDNGQNKTMDEPHPRSRTGGNHTVAITPGDLSSWYGQQIPFNELLNYGALQELSGGTYGAANGYTEGWDDCSDTPFLFDVARKTVVTYDDTYSLSDKASYAISVGMAGCFTWSLDQDYGTSLQSSIRSAMGLS